MSNLRVDSMNSLEYNMKLYRGRLKGAQRSTQNSKDGTCTVHESLAVNGVVYKCCLRTIVSAHGLKHTAPFGIANASTRGDYMRVV